MARTPPKTRQPLKQSRADSLTEAMDDSLAAKGYKAIPEMPMVITRGQKQIQMPKPENPKKLQQSKERQFIKKNPTTSI